MRQAKDWGGGVGNQSPGPVVLTISQQLLGHSFHRLSFRLPFVQQQLLKMQPDYKMPAGLTRPSRGGVHLWCSWRCVDREGAALVCERVVS